MNRLYDDEALLGLLRENAKALGRTPSIKRLNDMVGWRVSQTISTRFGSYVRACERAGLEPNRRVGGNRRRPQADERAAYARIAGDGPAPTLRGWDAARLPSEPSSAILRAQHGTWSNFIRAMGGSARPYRSQLELRSGAFLGRRAKSEVAA